MNAREACKLFLALICQMGHKKLKVVSWKEAEKSGGSEQVEHAEIKFAGPTPPIITKL